MKAFQIHVKGKVQGVFFRASTKEIADQLKLNGWVKNEPDGSVLIVVEGEPEQIDKLLDWCKKGPPLAKVSGMVCKEIETKGYERFEIRY